MPPDDTSATCPNCGAVTTQRWCGACGQDNARRRLELRPVVADALSNLTGWDRALGRTLRALFARPDVLVIEYVRGRRRSFVNPVRFCLLALALWLVLGRTLGVDALELAGLQFGASSPGDEPFVQRLRAFLERNLDVLLFLSLPMRAWLCQLAFRRSPRNVAENMVLVLYMAGFSYLLALLATPFAALGWDWFMRARPLIAFVWFVRALRGLHDHSWFETTWRAALVAAGHLAATVALMAGVGVPWVLWVG